MPQGSGFLGGGAVAFMPLLMSHGTLVVQHGLMSDLAASFEVVHSMRAAIVLKTAIAVSALLPVKRREISRLAQADLMHEVPR
ncbi:MAG: hypothetical protein Q7T96_19745 [Methylobacter sp.]|nr:hypothetical protein [Methylobacter sp.]